MKTYRVKVVFEVSQTVEIEAENDEEAKEMAYDDVIENTRCHWELLENDILSVEGDEEQE